MTPGTVPQVYHRGRQHLAAAITADEKHDYVLAVEEYQKCCELYLFGIRSDRDQKRKLDTIKRVKNYLARAEKIKEDLKKKSPVEIKHGGLDQVAGLDHVKSALQEAVLLPMLQPQVSQKELILSLLCFD